MGVRPGLSASDGAERGGLEKKSPPREGWTVPDWTGRVYS